MKQVSGKIIILINDKPKFANRIQYGFVQVKGMKEDVFFNSLTSFQGTTFENLKIGDKVHILVKQTDHGPYAENLALPGRPVEPELFCQKIEDTDWSPQILTGFF